MHVSPNIEQQRRRHRIVFAEVRLDTVGQLVKDSGEFGTSMGRGSLIVTKSVYRSNHCAVVSEMGRKS